MFSFARIYTVRLHTHLFVFESDSQAAMGLRNLPDYNTVM